MRGQPHPDTSPAPEPVATKRATAKSAPPTSPTPETASPEPTEALAALVTKLRAELTGVRTAMRNRAVIEQAKGVLVERLGITPDESFDHLVRLSQRANIKLIEVAAAIIGTRAPDPQATVATAPIDDELREHLARTRGRKRVAGAGGARRPPRPPAHEALQAQHQLISARVAAATSFDEVASAIVTGVEGWPEPSAVVITTLEPDGAHMLAGGHGLDAYDRSQWARTPPQFDVPIVAAARDRTPILITDPAVMRERYPAITDARYAVQSVLAAPLTDGDRVIGSVGLSWQRPLQLDETTRRYLLALAAPVARRVAELIGQAPHAAHAADPGVELDTWVPIVLETVPEPAALLAPVWQDGRIVDLRIEYANEPARALTASARIDDDATLLAVYPKLGSEMLLPRFAELLRGAGPVRLGPVRPDPDAVGTMITVRAGQLWDRVLMIWRVCDEAELLLAPLLEAERIARIGSFRWDLEDGQPYGSPQLYRMFHGDAPAHPIPVDELVACVHDDDVAEARDVVSRTVASGEHLSWEFRGAGPLDGRRLRIVAEPAVEAGGRISIRGTVQDVTDLRAVHDRLRRAEDALAAQRHRVDAEQRAARALQRALLPTEPEPEAATAAGLRVSGRSRSADRTGRVDGDWYDVCALPGGASLLSVGDVAGSGLAALTAAARLRYAVRAYAALDMSPGEILAAVNSMLCSLEPERTATLVVAHFTRDTRRLRWAVAGQAAPVRYRRDGHAELLTGSRGLPVGAAPEQAYPDHVTDLEAGDRLLLYTDSLVGGRGTDLVGALDVLLAAGVHATSDDLEALVGYVVEALHGGPDEDMGAMLVRVNG